MESICSPVRAISRYETNFLQNNIFQTIHQNRTALFILFQRLIAAVS